MRYPSFYVVFSLVQLRALSKYHDHFANVGKMVELKWAVVRSSGQLRAYYWRQKKGHCISMLLTDAINEWFSTKYPDLVGTISENGGTNDG